MLYDPEIPLQATQEKERKTHQCLYKNVQTTTICYSPQTETIHISNNNKNQPNVVNSHNGILSGHKQELKYLKHTKIWMKLEILF